MVRENKLIHSLPWLVMDRGREKSSCTGATAQRTTFSPCQRYLTNAVVVATRRNRSCVESNSIGTSLRPPALGAEKARACVLCCPAMGQRDAPFPSSPRVIAPGAYILSGPKYCALYNEEMGDRALLPLIIRDTAWRHTLNAPILVSDGTRPSKQPIPKKKLQRKDSADRASRLW